MQTLNRLPLDLRSLVNDFSCGTQDYWRCFKSTAISELAKYAREYKDAGTDEAITPWWRRYLYVRSEASRILRQLESDGDYWSISYYVMDDHIGNYGVVYHFQSSNDASNWSYTWRISRRVPVTPVGWNYWDQNDRLAFMFETPVRELWPDNEVIDLTTSDTEGYF